MIVPVSKDSTSFRIHLFACRLKKIPLRGTQLPEAALMQDAGCFITLIAT